MKLKSLIVLLLAGIWGVGGWWWYTCKVKGFCGADVTTAQVAAGTAAVGAAAMSANEDPDKAPAMAEAATEQPEAEKAAAEKAAAEQAEAEKAAAEKAAAEQVEAEKAAAEKAAAEQVEAEKAAAEKAATEQAEAEKAAAEKAAAEKAEAEKAATEQEQADADKVTMETSASAAGNGSGIDPATLHFPTGSANTQLADDTKAYFEKVTNFLKENQSAKVTITGHTDDQGDAGKNKALGLKRAELIKQMLSDMGAPTDRITASSEGEDKPVADNKTPEGRKKNRRVEVTPEQ
ncbi:MAG: OmpA family protein [Gammaproteobacteria bacterium]|nr:OmpA family protein [Gammaproteobacteria bacterium]MBU1723921.1 OmpA family protein [Gammaproteobacteria bacterium]MBU2006170.1 OmpA family protein [Gammaproteobacteria bacterium]